MKRLILLLTVYFSLLTSAEAAILAGQQTGISVGSAVTSQDLAFSSTVTTGDFIIVSGATYSGPPVTLTVTADCGTLTLLAGNDTGFTQVFIAYGLATSTGTCTVTVAGDDIFFPTFAIKTFTGVNSTPLDVDGGFSLSAGSTTAVADITTVATNALIIGVAAPFNVVTITPDSAFTEIYEEEDGSTYQAINLVYRIVPTPSTYSVLWNFSSVTPWSMYVASFKPAGAAGGPVVRHRPIMQ